MLCSKIPSVPHVHPQHLLQTTIAVSASQGGDVALGDNAGGTLWCRAAAHIFRAGRAPQSLLTLAETNENSVQPESSEEQLQTPSSKSISNPQLPKGSALPPAPLSLLTGGETKGMICPA